MGGSSNPIKSVVEDIKKEVKKVDMETVGSFGMNKVYDGIYDATGVKADFMSPASWLGGEAGEKLFDKPKEAKEKMAAEQAAAASAQEAQLREIEGRRKQASAEKRGAEDLMRARQRQRRRTGGTGRGSTILSGNLGGVSGDGRKNLLGL